MHGQPRREAAVGAIPFVPIHPDDALQRIAAAGFAFAPTAEQDDDRGVRIKISHVVDKRLADRTTPRLRDQDGGELFRGGEQLAQLFAWNQRRWDFDFADQVGKVLMPEFAGNEKLVGRLVHVVFRVRG